jgi:hypothetical protein
MRLISPTIVYPMPNKPEPGRTLHEVAARQTETLRHRAFQVG